MHHGGISVVCNSADQVPSQPLNTAAHLLVKYTLFLLLLENRAAFVVLPHASAAADQRLATHQAP